LEGGNRGLVLRHLPGDPNENHEKPVGISGIAAKTRTEFLLNYTNLLGLQEFTHYFVIRAKMPECHMQTLQHCSDIHFKVVSMPLKQLLVLVLT
jgi:hypothetical protein